MMTCKEIKKLLPLYAENDLPEKKAARVKSHIKDCPLCQKEYKKYKRSLSQSKKWIRSKTLEWDEKEWGNTLDRAFRHKKRKNKIFVPLSFKPTWVVALILVVAVGLSIFVANPSLIKIENSAVLASAIKSEDSQEKIELTFVSNRTGLEIKWVFNNKFNLKEEIK